MTILLSLAKFGLQNWRWVLIAALITACGLYRHALLNAEEQIDDIQNQRRVEIAVNQAIINQVKERSQTTLKRINDEHKTVVEQAEKNAWRNFTKRYGTGTGFNGCGSIGLRVPAPDSATPDSPEGANEPTGEPMAIDITGIKQFAEACGRDAGQVKQWQDWATGNGFPIEK